MEMVWRNSGWVRSSTVRCNIERGNRGCAQLFDYNADEERIYLDREIGALADSHGRQRTQ